MRKEVLLDTGWKFHRGDIKYAYSSDKGIAYYSSKTERALLGPACKDYPVSGRYDEDTAHKTENWETVSVPHDYLAFDGYDPSENEGLGFCHYENAWYVQRFSTEKGDEQKRLSLYFEGVATHATVWVNGCLVKRNFCGYTSFEADITDVVFFDRENVISVYVSAEEHEGWWYEGAGIYRNVYLVKTEKVAVDLYGVYVKPEFSDGKWNVRIETTVRNDSYLGVRPEVRHEIVGKDGKKAAEVSVCGTVSARDVRTLVTSAEVTAPELWSPESPVQYTVVTRVFRGKTELDKVENKFGFRTFRVDPDNGLFINGKPYKIKGFCGHESVGFCGKAVPDNLQRHRVRLMKEMGANGYRTTHYPQSVALMDALDEAGFIVMDETRWFESTEEGLAGLEMLVKRDRNRPSVFFWSVGNEEPITSDNRGSRIFRAMKAFVEKLDDRPVVTAVTHDPEKVTLYDDTPVVCLNYKWDHFDGLREKYPKKPFLSSECGATGTTRGWYHESDDRHGLRSAYDETINNAFRSRERSWKFIFERPWVIGGYHWNLGEYRGEAVWPRVTSVSGTLDLYLQKKDAFWQHQSFFSDTPMVHLLPHWNHEGLEGEPQKVVAYTNQPSCELFLNGKSVGKRELSLCEHAEWSVPYEKGKIEVVAYDANGNEAARDVRETTGSPVSLRLTLDTPDVCANGHDLAVITCAVTDEQGRTVPDAQVDVRFIVEGCGTLFSTGAVNIDHTPIGSPERRTWMGSASCAVQTTKEAGTVRVTVTSCGLKSAYLEFQTK